MSGKVAQHVTFPRIGLTVSRRPPEHRQATDHSLARSAPATVTCQSCHVRHVDQSAFGKSSHAPPTQQQQRPPAVKLVIRMLTLVATTTLQTLLTFLDSIYGLLLTNFARIFRSLLDYHCQHRCERFCGQFCRSKCGKSSSCEFSVLRQADLSSTPTCHTSVRRADTRPSILDQPMMTADPAQRRRRKSIRNAVRNVNVRSHSTPR